MQGFSILSRYGLNFLHVKSLAIRMLHAEDIKQHSMHRKPTADHGDRSGYSHRKEYCILSATFLCFRLKSSVNQLINRSIINLTTRKDTL